MLGRFITIEGIEGAGKSTQTESLLKHLADQGVSVLHTREPGGTPLAEKIRAMLLADDMAPDAETLLFFAARADHVRRVIGRLWSPAAGCFLTALPMLLMPIKWAARGFPARK